MPLAAFHPITRRWFQGCFREPTEPQRRGWPEIAARRDTLIAAPTGSGKTLAAFLACLDELLQAGLAGTLDDGVRVVYVSPLKALSNDIRRNLIAPLEGLRAAAGEAGFDLPEIRAAVRTGDTPSSQRQAMLRRPPHILVTTPESLYLVLTSEKARWMLQSADTVIVDEIHALARDKRGSHLSLSLERLQSLCGRPLRRIGLSATQRPIEEIAGFLVGGRRCDRSGRARCRTIDVGHMRQLDLDVEVPPSELSAVCTNEQWAEIYETVVERIKEHRSTLVFVNTRRLAERVTHHLSERLGEDHVTSHHGSLSRKLRLDAERRLKSGQLKALVATASLELGIDIGFVDLVCQIGSPRSMATFLQRIGRSGHALGRTPKGRLFPLSRDDLVESLALLRAVRGGRLDAIEIPPAPLDILAQQIVAAVACEPWGEDDLYRLVRRSWSYRNLARSDFDAIIEMLSLGVGRGTRRGAFLHRDAVNRRLRARRGARLTALTCGGAIPDAADYRVVTEGEGTLVGTVNEDFAIESLAGDVFLLGNTSWRIKHVRGGEVTVNDAQGAPATIPFWFGEAPGRTVELSAEVSDLRSKVGSRLLPIEPLPRATPREQPSSQLPVAEKPTAEKPTAEKPTDERPTDSRPRMNVEEVHGHAAGEVQQPEEAVADWLRGECGCGSWAARQVVGYIAAQKAALGLVPNQREVVFERFFDESGGMQMVIHAPFGSRINRAWGLALRKRFCRSFNFELQAAADDNGMVLSLGVQHSFPLEQMFRMLHPGNAEHLLKQALLAAPMFLVRWRWNITRALAVPRRQGGKRVPPPLQRMRSDDLLSAIFPETTGCLENHTGDIDIPDHPLVAQTVFDCLHEAMDVDRWLALLGEVSAGRVRLIARDTREPSPFCYEILNANPYAFLDDAPLEERRARAVATRRTLSADDLRDLATFDPQAIAQVRAEAWPLVRDAEELHDTLLMVVALPEHEGQAWSGWFQELVADGRAAALPLDDDRRLWFAAERWPYVRAIFPGQASEPTLELPPELQADVASAEALVELVRGRLGCVGPTTASEMAGHLGVRAQAVAAALEALEGQGAAMQGRFTIERQRPNDPPGGHPPEWCDRRLLARIHRLTLEGARKRVRPVRPETYLRMLFEWQHVAAGKQASGRAGLLEVIDQLQGFEISAAAWEQEILPARIDRYDPHWLDELSFSGEVVWGRLVPPRHSATERSSRSGMTRAMRISLVERTQLKWLLPGDRASAEALAGCNARAVRDALKEHGALFFDELIAATGLLSGYVEKALGELAALGMVSADGFAMVRKLVSPAAARRSRAGRGARRQTRRRAFRRGGRWSRFPGPVAPSSPEERAERWARLLVNRYGVVFRDLLSRETGAPPWYELRGVYRRLEARGEIFGGRFVADVAGEQYADRRAVARLRELRERPEGGSWVVISAADPLNLAGIVTGNRRITATPANRLVLRDGRLIASRQHDKIEYHAELDVALKREIEFALRLSGEIRMAVRNGEHQSPMPRAAAAESVAADAVSR